MHRRRLWRWAGVGGGFVVAAAVAVALTLPPRLPKAPATLPAPASIVSASSGSTAGSVSNPQTPSTALSAVFFLDSRHGWAGGHGIILGTATGGQTWSREYSGPASVTQVDFVDADHGWALTEGGLLVTTDGGRRWIALPTSSPALTEVDFLTAEQGWGVRGSRLVSTADGGRTWRSVATATPVQSVCFGDQSVGWAAGGSTVLRSTDGGRTWVVAYRAPVTQGGFRATVHCVGAGTAWVLLQGGVAMFHQAYAVFFTDNGGQSWSEPLAEPFFPAYPKAPHVIDSHAGPFVSLGTGSAVFLGVCGACGAGIVSSLTATDDGGKTVTHDYDLYGIPAPPGSAGAASALAFTDRQHGWIVSAAGNQGRIYATSDGGQSWTQQYPPSGPRPLQAVSMVTTEQGYGLGSVGNAGAILETRDGGRNWSLVGEIAGKTVASSGAGPGTGPSLSLSFANATDGWAIAYGKVERTTDGGRTWLLQALPAVRDQGPGSTVPQSVAFLPNGQVGCIQFGDDFPNPQTYLGTTDGGGTWAPVAMPGTKATLNSNGHVVPGAGAADGALACAMRETGRWSGPLQAIAKSGTHPLIMAVATPSSLWATGTGGGLMTTADGGGTWATYGVPGSAPIQSVSFIDPQHGWLLTGDGELFETADGGASWGPTSR